MFFFFYTKIAKGNPKAIRTLNNGGDVGDSRCKVRWVRQDDKAGVTCND
jgi:hypothetical protein